MFKGLDGVWIAGAMSDILSVIITFFVFIKTTKGLIESGKTQKVAIEK